MSQRYTLLKKFEEIAAFYKAKPFAGDAWDDNYNISQGQLAPVLVEEPDGRELRLMQWGLIPFWSKDKKIGAGLAEARAEELKEKPAFRDPFKDKRCIVPLSGFYEWQKLSTVKIPYYFAPGDGLLSCAGLWSSWVSPQMVEVETFTMVTTPASDVVKPISDRMPLLLANEGLPPWLAKSTLPIRLQELLDTPAPAKITATAVSKYVNALKSAGPKCVEPLPSKGTA